MTEEKNTNTFKTMEIYGFVVWVLSYILFVVYFIWSFVPDEIFESYGIYYYPDKHFAKIIPCLLVMIFLVGFIILEGNSLFHNFSEDSVYNV